MEEKRCLLCNKPYDYKYKMFGRNCLDNIYGILGFHKPPRFVWNKELYLCTRIAWKNHKFFLNKNKKYNFTKDEATGWEIRVYDIDKNILYYY